MTVLDFRGAVDRRRLVDAFSVAGWSMQNHPTDDHVGGTVIYHVDIKSGRLYATALTVNAIPIATRMSKEIGLTFDDVCDYLGSLLTALGSDEVAFDTDARNDLTVLSVLYISCTNSYATAMKLNLPRLQFLVIHMPDASSGQNLLRPVPLNSPDPLSPEYLETVVNRVLEIDRRNHPERFLQSKVIQFRLKMQPTT